MIGIEVRTQAEFEAAIKRGDKAICMSGIFRLSAGIGARAIVELRGSARLVADYGSNSSVVAWENSSVVARGNSSVVAWENSSVEAWENSSVEARENSSVVARENSSVVAWENSSVVARGNSSVEAWGYAFIRWFSALRIKASLSVIVAKIGSASGSIEGGRVLDCPPPTTPEAWCEHYGVGVSDGVAILFKAVDDDYSTERARSRRIFYAPGTIPEAPDWDGGKAECGGGLHFSPAAAMALDFNGGAKRFVACPVKLSDIAVHPDGDYPHKVKAKGCCAPVWEVDRRGKRIEAKEAAAS